MAWLRGIPYLLCLALCCGAAPAHAQMPAQASAMLEKMAGSWILAGKIAGQETTHDVTAGWVLDREYMWLHEVSREKNAHGGPAYEAILYIGWDAKVKQFVCLWLDSTSGDGLSSGVIARGPVEGDSIPFLFTISASDQIHTTFRYDRVADTWQWSIVDVADGKAAPFADVTLRRAP